VPPKLKTALQHDFSAGVADDDDCHQEIHDYYEKTGYVMDPHTAVASRVLSNYRNDSGDHTTALIAATASPFKFTATVCDSLYNDCSQKSDFELIHELSRRTGLEVPRQIHNIENWVPIHNDRCLPVDANTYVRKALSIGDL